MTADPTTGPSIAWQARRDAARLRREERFRTVAHALAAGKTPTEAITRAEFPSLIAARRTLHKHGEHGLANMLTAHPKTKRHDMDDTDMARIEDFEFCLSTGEWPERAWKRAGFDSEDEARNVLASYGRHDLARKLIIEPVQPENSDQLAWI